MVGGTSTRRAVGYLRVSTPGQAEEDRESLPAQEARIAAYCQRAGLMPIATFVDVASGRRDDRRHYQKMVALVRGGGADTIVVQYLDRFGRNPREILRRVWELQELGAEVVATDEDIKEELILLVRAGVAGAESKRNSERVRAYMVRHAAKGTIHFGRAPYGYQRVRSGEHIAYPQDPAEAAAVREMARLVLEENLGFRALVDRLNAAGYRARSGAPWARDTVRKVLRNEALAGVHVYGKVPRKGNPTTEVVRVPGFYDPPILTADEWGALQARLSLRREHPRGRTFSSGYLLSGIARCGYCGGPMTGKRGRMYKGTVYTNYWCARAQRSREHCAYPNGHSARRLEAAVLEYLGRYSDPDTVRELLAADATDAAGRAAAELRKVERDLAALDEDFQRNLDLLKRGILDEAEFVKANTARRTERAALETKRAELSEQDAAEHARQRTAATLPARVRSFLEDVQAMDVRQAKPLLAAIVKAVHVYRDTLELEFRQ